MKLFNNLLLFFSDRFQNSKEKQYKKTLKSFLGFYPGNIELYRLALTHRSVAKILPGGLKNSNERLEFLGDSILNMIAALILFENFPNKDEGFLTEMRAKMVNRIYMNELSKKMGIQDLVLLNEKEFHHKQTFGSVLGNALESIIGAIYLDKGFKKAYNFYKKRVCDRYIKFETLLESQINYKSKLIEWGQKNGKIIEFSSILSETDEKTNIFTISILVAGQIMGTSQNISKKNAEKLAAEQVCQKLMIL